MTLDRTAAHAAALYNADHAKDILPGTDLFAHLVAGWQGAKGLTADGQLGPRTRAALEAVVPKEAPAGSAWTPFDGPLTSRPKTRAEVIKMFGDPGVRKAKVDEKWQRENIVELHGEKAFIPVLAKSYFPIHKLIEPYAREAFHRAELAAPGYIQRDGTWGFNFRHMRHDLEMPLSYHSWGIAFDINPDDNEPVSFDAGEKPALWSDAWTKQWKKGVPRALVEAIESCGFSWGGRWLGYCDPMHFEWLGARDVQV